MKAMVEVMITRWLAQGSGFNLWFFFSYSSFFNIRFTSSFFPLEQ